MNKDKINNNFTNQKEVNKNKGNNETDALKEALASKSKETEEVLRKLEEKNKETAEIRQVLEEEEEKGLLRKHGFSIGEFENIRLLGKGKITEELLRELKQKAYQKKTSAFISLLQDDDNYRVEKQEPWENTIKYMEKHPKGKVR